MAGRPDDADEQTRAAVRQLGVDDHVQGVRYLDWFRALNYDYPFLDYSQDSALADDRDLMARYASFAGAPPPTSTWKGERILLPTRATPASRATLVARWLRLSAGITHLGSAAHASIAFRTSPSGGGRQPTDLLVRFGADWRSDDLPFATAWYDGLAHSLVECSLDVSAAMPDPGRSDLVIGVVSHVERAMWRYRDVRAFRPVLVDAGHVVETLMTVVEADKFRSAWHPSAAVLDVNGQLDPTFGYVVVSASRDQAVSGDRHDVLPPVATTNDLRASPFVSLRVAGDNLVAQCPSNREIYLKPAMVDAIAHAIPSSRGDRSTTVKGISDATGADRSSIGDLVSAGILMPAYLGDQLWRSSRHWFESGWYLSLLAHLTESSGASITARLPVSRPPSLAVALDRRRTTRSFSAAALPDDVVCELIRTVQTASSDVHVVLTSSLDVPALARGTYALSPTGLLTDLGIAPASSNDIVKAAIGQPWATGFHVVCWLIPQPDHTVGAWEAAMLELGRTAQRVALAVCHDPSVGVFQSPALIDKRLAELLPGVDHLDGAYMVGVGRTQPSERVDVDRAFYPSHLFPTPS